jgi:nicotinate-nucleotide pyrophosphorylase (carboxylating)
MRVRDLLKEAIKEDLGRGDLFSFIAQPKHITADIKAKSDGIFAGRKYIRELPSLDTSETNIEFPIRDGDSFKKGDILATISGNSNIILSYERVILNILQHASGIATNTNQYVKLIEGYDVKILDTRKTNPMLRELEKYAVRCGGGINHRLGLDDCLMLKDTHVATIQNLKEFMIEVRKKIPWTSKVEIECETYESVKEAMEAGADIIMCDNMSIDTIKSIVKFRDKNYPSILLEASGNISKDNIIEYAKTGVDAISSGSLIHQSTWVDISMRVRDSFLVSS